MSKALERERVLVTRHPAIARPLVIWVVGLLVVAFVLRVGLGLQESIDGDEAVEGITALRILQGHFTLMESNGHYLGAVESYILVPFVVLFGPTLVALRVAMSVIGVASVAALYWLGRTVLGTHRDGLLVAAVASLFPFFVLTFAVRARNYALVIFFEAVCLAFTARLGWSSAAMQWRDWALFGLAVGVGMWNNILLGIPLMVCLGALLLRAHTLGWRRVLQGAATAFPFAALGFAPWIIYNVQTGAGSLRHLYAPFSAYQIPTGQAVYQVLTAAIPIFVGARGVWCGPATIPPLLTDLAVGILLAGAFWVRRERWRSLASGQWARLQPVDMVLAVAPVAIAAVTIRWFNALSCEPRYLVPLAVPLVLAAALALRQAIPWAAALGGATVLAVNGITVSADRADGIWQVGPTVNLPAVVAALERERPEAVWATYVLARQLQYISGDKLVMGEYDGYVGFPDTQMTALHVHHPSWIFSRKDPDTRLFEAICAQRGITYNRVVLDRALILYEDLSEPLAPEDVGLGGQLLPHAG